MFRKGSYLVLIVLFAIDCGKSKKEDLQGGVFTFIKGSIKLSDKAGKEKKVGLSEFILPEDKIETTKDSYADIQLMDGVIIRVKESTSLTLNRIYVDSKNSEIYSDINLNKGKIFSRIGTKLTKSSGFKITTPTSTAAVRGTDFQVEVEGNKTETLVSEGSVEVVDNDNPDLSNVVDAGGKIVSDGKSQKEEKLSEDELKELQEDAATIQSVTEEQRQRIEEILKDFKENKERILQGLEEQKQRNQELINATKEENRRMIDEVKESGKAEKEAIKSAADEERKNIKSGIDKDREAIENSRKSLKDQVKPQ
ncbi:MULTISPECIES: surface adhesin Lsa33 [Leptospira]|uniref:Sigma factor regulatory protein, FecR/PupR family n=4 Tax=Leptospira borgpetersenii TaxID=174 RepID=M3GV93_LEPBO|nr:MULTISPECIES: FecR family protein [Leptospira]EMF98763.1 sigma factor regulatory protein, FecR/PupR family [Leptospira borgpetersenii str. 200701203]AXX15793.1 iron dicitrate transport regulator FecR [Leptospira borgpetersenii serovar Ceylonica]EKP13915.1 sigma factor regulatory protein, FecR/PupR family [Leptospira borgpetersenii str. 200801926]EKQ93124.1 sigma factor regulatory protein, FecR/PupR family [Leptospira borgpetersenii str. UI 09149]EMK09888.1 sigma factor regulatory protein, F